jgi:hypothetical protein
MLPSGNVNVHPPMSYSAPTEARFWAKFEHLGEELQNSQLHNFFATLFLRVRVFRVSFWVRVS